MSSAERLRASEYAHGFWSMTAHPGILDAAASAGPDFICVDTQHGTALGALDIDTFTTIAYYDVTSLVRVEALDEAQIGRALDLGADGVVIPLVRTAEDARRAVAACRYAPRGTRSFGVQTRRTTGPDGGRPVCWIQIETAEAMDHLEEIASLEGVDGLYIGPADLGLALVGEPAGDVESVFDRSHTHADVMQAAFEAVVAACHEAGVAPGLHCGSGKAAVNAAARGFRVTAVASDVGLVGHGLVAELNAAGPGDE